MEAILEPKQYRQLNLFINFKSDLLQQVLEKSQIENFWANKRIFSHSQC